MIVDRENHTQRSKVWVNNIYEPFFLQEPPSSRLCDVLRRSWSAKNGKCPYFAWRSLTNWAKTLAEMKSGWTIPGTCSPGIPRTQKSLSMPSPARIWSKITPNRGNTWLDLAQRGRVEHKTKEQTLVWRAENQRAAEGASPARQGKSL